MGTSFHCKHHLNAIIVISMLLCISAIPAMILFLKQMATHQKSNFVPEATPIQNSFPLYDTGLHDEMITLHGAGNLTL